MITRFNFKSQVCTSIEQSRRLLALGLKKETADMVWLDYSLHPDVEDWRICADYEDWGTWQEGGIPAWSLHRLMILAEMKGTAFSDLDAAYETTISIIAAKIRFGKDISTRSWTSQPQKCEMLSMRILRS